MSTGAELGRGCLAVGLTMLKVFGLAILYLVFLLGATPLVAALRDPDGPLPFFSVPVAVVLAVVGYGLLVLAVRFIGRSGWARMSAAMGDTRTTESYYGPDAVPVRHGMMELATFPGLLLVPVLVVVSMASGVGEPAGFVVVFAGLLPFVAGLVGRYGIAGVSTAAWFVAAGVLLWGPYALAIALMAILGVAGWAVLGTWLYRRYQRYQPR